jgi:hypothetical protein
LAAFGKGDKIGRGQRFLLDRTNGVNPKFTKLVAVLLVGVERLPTRRPRATEDAGGAVS